MELRHLRYFVAVAEEQNVTRAATRLHVSQPPLTRQIHDLEEELGVSLFERNGKSIRLTGAGRVFLVEAQASLKRVDEAVQAARASAAGQYGELHVGYAPSPTVGILPRILRAVRKKAPGVRIRLHDHSSPEMLAGLREQRLQAAFMMQPSKQAGRGIAFEKLCEYPLVVAMARDHQWARQRALALPDVLAAPLIAYSRKVYPDFHELLQRIAGTAAKHLRFEEECDSGTSFIAAIESGQGIAITAASLARSAGHRLRFVPLTPAPEPAVLGIAYLPRRATPSILSLVEAAKSAAPGNHV